MNIVDLQFAQSMNLKFIPDSAVFAYTYGETVVPEELSPIDVAPFSIDAIYI